MGIAQRLKQVCDDIAKAAEQAGRKSSEIRLVAVSKVHPAEMIVEAVAAGQRDFGENYVQEALNKIQQFHQYANISWHFIGYMQSNKAKLIAEHFDWVHSVDRLDIAKRLSRFRSTEKPALQVCLQISISHERSKSGLRSLSELKELLQACYELPNINVRGIMAMPALATDPDLQYAAFKQVADIKGRLVAETDIPLDTLSMGMSNDFGAAILAGSTMVRIGSAIFGPRSKKEI